MIGVGVDLTIGAKIRPTHGTPAENTFEAHPHDAELTIVGRLDRSGTPWDRAILVPIEALWAMHANAGDESAVASSRVGPPWSAADAKPVPALVVRPVTVSDAYRLRQQFRGKEATALFPAEVLNPL